MGLSRLRGGAHCCSREPRGAAQSARCLCSWAGFPVQVEHLTTAKPASQNGFTHVSILRVNAMPCNANAPKCTAVSRTDPAWWGVGGGGGGDGSGGDGIARAAAAVVPATSGPGISSAVREIFRGTGLLPRNPDYPRIIRGSGKCEWRRDTCVTARQDAGRSTVHCMPAAGRPSRASLLAVWGGPWGPWGPWGVRHLKS